MTNLGVLCIGHEWLDLKVGYGCGLIGEGRHGVGKPNRRSNDGDDDAAAAPRWWRVAVTRREAGGCVGRARKQATEKIEGEVGVSVCEWRQKGVAAVEIEAGEGRLARMSHRSSGGDGGSRRRERERERERERGGGEREREGEGEMM